MQDQVFLLTMLLLACCGLAFGRYQYKRSTGIRHKGLFLLEVAFSLVILYVLGVWMFDFPIINAREILLVFMAIIVAILGIVSVDDWFEDIKKMHTEAQKKEAKKMRAQYESRYKPRAS